MFELVKLLLPVLWAIVATAVGVVLYKSSSALFESRQASEGSTRKLRLAGSVTIAAVAFFGLWYATPQAALHPNLNGYAQYSVALISRIADLSEQINNKALDLAACLSEPLPDCQRQATDLQSLTAKLDSLVHEVADQQ